MVAISVRVIGKREVIARIAFDIFGKGDGALR